MLASCIRDGGTADNRTGACCRRGDWQCPRMRSSLIGFAAHARSDESDAMLENGFIRRQIHRHVELQRFPIKALRELEIGSVLLDAHEVDLEDAGLRRAIADVGGDRRPPGPGHGRRGRHPDLPSIFDRKQRLACDRRWRARHTQQQDGRSQEQCQDGMPHSAARHACRPKQHGRLNGMISVGQSSHLAFQRQSTTSRRRVPSRRN
jgi:hypothetical protein